MRDFLRRIAQGLEPFAAYHDAGDGGSGAGGDGAGDGGGDGDASDGGGDGGGAAKAYEFTLGDETVQVTSMEEFGQVLPKMTEYIDTLHQKANNSKGPTLDQITNALANANKGGGAGDDKGGKDGDSDKTATGGMTKDETIQLILRAQNIQQQYGAERAEAEKFLSDNKIEGVTLEQVETFAQEKELPLNYAAMLMTQDKVREQVTQAARKAGRDDTRLTIQPVGGKGSNAVKPVEEVTEEELWKMSDKEFAAYRKKVYGG
ncbi:hypothetical protein KQI63_05830 [bacterium]|nr:hypothetical protein [bacterium]